MVKRLALLRAPRFSRLTVAAFLAGGGTAVAQSLPPVQTLPTTPSEVDAITPGIGVIYAVPLDDISPTQMNAGYSELAKKTADWNYLPADQLQATLLTDIEPVVIGPGGVLYLLNGHHTFTSLQDSTYGPTDPTVYVNVVANYSSETPAQFAQTMQLNGLVYPVNDGVPVTISPTLSSPLSPIPNSLQGLTNDPYRGLEFSVLKNKFPGGAGAGFDKTGDDFSDYIWAQAYQNANNGLGLAHASPGDVNAAAVFSQTATNQTTIVGVTSPTGTGTTTNVTVGQLPGYIIQNSLTLSQQITNATLSTGALAANGTFTGINGLYLNQGGTTLTLEPAQPGFVMQLGSNGSTSVTLTNGANSYTGGTYIAAGTLVTAINVSPNGDALGAPATGAAIDLGNGNLNVQASVQSSNGIVFNSLSEGNGTLVFGTNTTGGTSFTENRNIAVGAETAIINTNGNAITLTGQIATSNIGEGGFAGLTLDDTAGSPGTLIINPSAPAGNSGFYGNFIISNGTLEMMSNSGFGNSSTSAIDLDGGTFKAGANLTSPGTNVFLTGGSTLDLNGFVSTFGNLDDTQRILTIANSGGSTGTGAGSASFGSSEFVATATLLFSGSNASSIGLGDVTREGNATLIFTPHSTASALGTTDKVFATGSAANTNNGIVAPWIIIDSGGSASTNPYNFATYGANGFTTATYNSTSIATASSSSVVMQSSNVSLSSNAAAYALNLQNGKTITVGSNILALGDGTDPAGLIMNGSAAINGGTLAFGGSEAVIWAKSSNSIGSIITGTGGLTLAGSGTLTLTGTESYSGATTVDSGTLALTTPGEIADTSGVTLEDTKSKPSAAILALTANQTFAMLNSAGNNSSVTLGSGAAVTIGTTSGSYANESSTFSGAFTESGASPGAAIIKAGTGLLNLSGESKGAISLVSGASVSVTGGDLRIASNIFASTSTQISLGGGTELQFAQGGGGAFANPITGQGDVRLLGGTLQLTGGAGNTYGGGTYVEWGGVLDTNTASIPGNIYSSGTVVFDQNTNGAYSGVISNGVAGQMIGSVQPGNFVKDDSTGGNSGNVTVANVQTYTGSTTVEAGTLTLGATNAIASSSSVDLGRIGGGATAMLSLSANNLVNNLGSEQGDTTTVALNGNTLTVNEENGQQSTYRGSITDTSGGAVVKAGSGTLDLAGPTNGSSNTIAGNVAVSQGTLAVTGGISFSGTVTNNAAFISDPADLTFGNLNVGSTGFIQAAPGDVYNVTGNFINNSTQAGSWNTAGAILEFSGGTSYEMTLTAQDLGLYPIQRAPFLWGALELMSTSDVLTLENGLSSGPVAFYVDKVAGLDITGDLITNIFGDGYNIYYDPYLAANAYLDGQDYQLENGGELIADTPEPASLSLLLPAVLSLGWLRRKRSGWAQRSWKALPCRRTAPPRTPMA